MAAIEAVGLTKTYGSRRGVTDLNLVVEQGESFGYLGPNGAGKTTTIRMLLDLLRPTSGHVRVLGMDPITQGPALRRRIGYLPGELTMESQQNVKELLTFFGRLRGEVPTKRINELAERLELDLTRKIKGLSKGNKQKIGLVQAFMHTPDLLILDEPTSGLDPLMQQVFLELIAEAKANGQTVFMSSHILTEVQESADRVGIIRDGRMISVSSLDSLIRKAVRRVEIRFGEPVPASELSGLPNVSDVQSDGSTVTCSVDGSFDALIKTVARYRVESFTSQEPDLESIFLDQYERSEYTRVG